MPRSADSLGTHLAGLDVLDAPLPPSPPALQRLWHAAWPRLAAAATALGLWELAVLTRVRPDYVLPPPKPVLARLVHDLGTGRLLHATAVTMTRAAAGFALAVFLGSLTGVAVSSARVVRAAVGSLLTGLQTMPTIAWFPFAVLLFGLSEQAIIFVVVLGAAPAVATGLISGVDAVPPVLRRAGRVLGARGFRAWRHVVLPAALPGLLAGLKQGWAFAWRSLMAGELIVVIASRPSLGFALQSARDTADAPGLLATMLVILFLGIAVDGLAFAPLERAVLRRWGLGAG